MVDYAWIGIAGLALLVIAWVPETLTTIRERKSPLDLKFSLVYTFGSLGLMIYALLIHDWIFTLLNTLTTLMALLNVYYKINQRENRKENKKDQSKKK